MVDAAKQDFHSLSFVWVDWIMLEVQLDEDELKSPKDTGVNKVLSLGKTTTLDDIYGGVCLIQVIHKQEIIQIIPKYKHTLCKSGFINDQENLEIFQKFMRFFYIFKKCKI